MQNQLRKKLKNLLKRLKIALLTDPFGGKKEYEYFFQNMAIMIAAGIEIREVLETLKSEVKSKSLVLKIESMKGSINEGRPLWKALEGQKILNSRLISIIRIGEESGRLVENLNIVIDQQEKDKKFQAKFRSAMIYPALVFLVMISVGIGVLVFILPNISDVYKRLGVELPWFTSIIVGIGDYFESYGIIVIPLLILIQILLFYIFFVFSRTKVMGQRLLFSISITRRLIREIEVGRFTFILGSMLKEGLPINYTIDSLSQSTQFYAYKNFYRYLAISIKEGNSFQDTFDSYERIENIIPLTIRQMISAGEKSGNLSDITIKISQIYENKNEITVKNLANLLEPLLLIIIWVAVAFFAISIVLPIYSLIGNFEALGGGGSSSTQLPTPTVNAKLTDIPNDSVSKVIGQQLKLKTEITDPIYSKSTASESSQNVYLLVKEETYLIVDKTEAWYRIKNSSNELAWVPQLYTEILVNE